MWPTHLSFIVSQCFFSCDEGLLSEDLLNECTRPCDGAADLFYRHMAATKSIFIDSGHPAGPKSGHDLPRFFDRRDRHMLAGGASILGVASGPDRRIQSIWTLLLSGVPQ